ncbi:acyltransferase domain-containing protein [Mycobacteroides abscessus]
MGRTRKTSWSNEYIPRFPTFIALRTSRYHEYRSSKKDNRLGIIMDRHVALFPGTTTPPPPGALADHVSHYPGIERMLGEIDGVSRAATGSGIAQYLTTGTSSPSELGPEQHYLSLMAVALSAFHVLTENGVEPYALVGQSIGELWAFIAAERLSVTEGAELACRRSKILTEFGWAGAMMPINAPASRVQYIVELVNDPYFVIAGFNSPRQTVVSGPRDAVALARNLVNSLGWAHTQIDVPHPTHSPAVVPAAKTFQQTGCHLPSRSLRWRILSPQLRRWLTEDDDPVSTIAYAMSHPVYLHEAVSTLAEQDATSFVHCGVNEFFEKMVAECCPAVPITSPLSSPDYRPVDIRPNTNGVGPQNTIHLPSHANGTGPSLVDIPMRTDLQVSTDSQPPGKTSMDKGTVIEQLRNLYAEKLGYPEEVLTDDAHLERDLGIESIRQTQLLEQAGEMFDVNIFQGRIRLLDYPTLDAIADDILQAKQYVGAVQ